MNILKADTHPLSEECPCIYVDGVHPKRSWGSEIKDVPFLVAIGVSSDGCRMIIGATATEGMKEDKASRCPFFVWLKERGLSGVHLIIGDKNLGMQETILEVFSDVRYIPSIFTDIFSQLHHITRWIQLLR